MQGLLTTSERGDYIHNNSTRPQPTSRARAQKTRTVDDCSITPSFLFHPVSSEVGHRLDAESMDMSNGIEIMSFGLSNKPIYVREEDGESTICIY